MIFNNSRCNKWNATEVFLEYPRLFGNRILPESSGSEKVIAWPSKICQFVGCKLFLFFFLECSIVSTGLEHLKPLFKILFTAGYKKNKHSGSQTSHSCACVDKVRPICG